LCAAAGNAGATIIAPTAATQAPTLLAVLLHVPPRTPRLGTLRGVRGKCQTETGARQKTLGLVHSVSSRGRRVVRVHDHAPRQGGRAPDHATSDDPRRQHRYCIPAA
jgi:hypothetical protein